MHVVRNTSIRRSRHTLLFLAANPNATTTLALDRECAEIECELRMTTNRDDFDFRSKWAVSIDDLARHLIELQPAVIHFSGHGAPNGGGIFVRDDARRAQLVSPRALAMLIESASSTRVVVLNACYSAEQADILCTVVDCVVGMVGEIRDNTARSFAVGFYRALGNGRSVGNAVAHGVATLAAKQLPGEHLPRCHVRSGMDAEQITLSARDEDRSMDA